MPCGTQHAINGVSRRLVLQQLIAKKSIVSICRRVFMLACSGALPGENPVAARGASIENTAAQCCQYGSGWQLWNMSFQKHADHVCVHSVLRPVRVLRGHALAG